MPEHMLTDPAFTVPPVPTDGPPVGIGWLRRTVARFTDGPDHARRRQLAVTMLATVSLDQLRRDATERTRAVLADADTVEVMASVARVVPIDVLRTALHLPTVPARTVAVIAQAYQPGAGDDEAADHAVIEAVDAFGGVADEATAAAIALLVQACDATAGLVGNAVLAMTRTDHPTDVVVSDTLRHDRPVLITRRRAPGGEVVTVELAGVPFGAGAHHCPGRDHAIAIAAGILDAVRGYRLVDQHIDYAPSRALRRPAAVRITRPGC